ncbi:hypothetical protein PG991_000740 [Apiospora marii]|uniref:Uncharacterized protein n=1 Tax=Apiospora marii TaxID=335849 RepID=A0ABR1SSU7_9PEZI
MPLFFGELRLLFAYGRLGVWILLGPVEFLAKIVGSLFVFDDEVGPFQNARPRVIGRGPFRRRGCLGNEREAESLGVRTDLIEAYGRILRFQELRELLGLSAVDDT